MIGSVNSFNPQVSAFLQPGRADQQQQATQIDDQRARRATPQQPQGEILARTNTDQRQPNRREAPFAGTSQDTSRSRSQGRGSVVDITV